jgi:hypothetical protein
MGDIVRLRSYPSDQEFVLEVASQRWFCTHGNLRSSGKGVRQEVPAARQCPHCHHKDKLGGPSSSCTSLQGTFGAFSPANRNHLFGVDFRGLAVTVQGHCSCLSQSVDRSRGSNNEKKCCVQGTVDACSGCLVAPLAQGGRRIRRRAQVTSQKRSFG